MGALERDGIPAHVRQIMDKLLAETMIEFTDEEARDPRPIATIAAPVFGHRGTVTLIVAVHPLAVHPRLEARRVAAVGRRLLRATTAIGAES
jgi:DNA-binding IclR family transcriptional regulator